MKKKILILMIACLMALVSACGVEELLPTDIDDSLLQKQNNKQNESTFAFDGDWVYGQFWDKEGESQFVHAHQDGTNLTVLDEKCWAQQITVVDDSVYYLLKQSADASRDGIYKIHPDGTGKVRLAGAADTMQIVGDKIYYNDAKDFYLHAVDLSGEQKEEILKKAVYYFFVFDDQILYQDDADGESLHIYNMATGKDKKVNDDISYTPIYDGEYIYYTKAEVSASSVQNEEEWEEYLKGHSIWRIRPNGEDKTQISKSVPGTGLLVTADSIYFDNYNDQYRIYRMDKDGENLKKISKEKNCEALAVFADTLKYTVRDNRGYIKNNYFSNLDGSNAHPFKTY